MGVKTNDELQRKFDMLYDRFMHEAPYDYLGILVWRLRHVFPSDNEIRAGTMQAAEREIAQGVKTVVFPKSRRS